MTSTLIGPPPATLSPAVATSPRGRVERAALKRVLDRIDGVRLVEGPSAPVAAAAGERPQPVLRVTDPRAWSAVMREGSAGLGEGYFRGWWDTDDLVGLMQEFIRNVGGLDEARRRVNRVVGPVIEPVRKLRRPNPDRDRRNVRAHYDLSNDFFAAFLDETMTYSGAVFETPDTPLAEASRAKLDRLCSKIGLTPDHRLIEIGSGWGSFALYAAGERGAHVTTTTISAAQADLARKRIAEAGLGHTIDLREQDYRHIDGTFDRLVSIEMIEAVDWRDVPGYLSTCSKLLQPDGVMGLQAIVIADQRWSRARFSTDFIKQWVFPGGCLPSVTSIAEATTRSTDLRIVDVEDFGAHYAETLRRWRITLHEAWDRLPSLNVSEELGRLWDFYLAYCEAAFRERHVSVVQVVLAKPDWRPDGLALRPA